MAQAKKCYAIIDESLFISTPDTFVAEMIEARMFSLIQNVTSEAPGQDMLVELVVAEES